MTTIVDGKKIAKILQQGMIDFLATKKQRPILHIVYVGSDSVVDNFVDYKKRFGRKIGAEVIIHNFDINISENKLIELINTKTAKANGVIIQLPLPDHLDTERILNIIPAEKDIDVLADSTKELFIKNKTSFFPPVTGSICLIARQHDIDFRKSDTLIVGNGALVGYPTMLWMDREGYNYTLVNRETDVYVVHQLMNEADIIISGAGQPHMVKDFFIKEGAILFDAGTSESGKKIVGDIDPSCFKKAALVTPVPGGIGPLTIAVLYYNLLHASYNDYDRNINTTAY